MRLLRPSAVCFHCQQAVEKYLKAFLVANEVEIVRTHNIEFLLAECASIENVFSDINPKNLSDFGVDVRYPGDLYIPEESEVLESVNIALQVKNIVNEKLKNLLCD